MGPVRRADRVSLFLRGRAALKLDAIAYFLWTEKGESSARPSKTDAVVAALTRPGVLVAAEIRLFRCSKCDRVYGAPWCWEHEGRAVAPVPVSLPENDHEKDPESLARPDVRQEDRPEEERPAQRRKRRAGRGR